MAKDDYEVEVKVHLVHWNVGDIVGLLCLAAVLIAGMHYGYECGCPGGG